MFRETIDKLTDTAPAKTRWFAENPAGIFVSAAMAGISVGFGILACLFWVTRGDAVSGSILMAGAYGSPRNLPCPHGRNRCRPSRGANARAVPKRRAKAERRRRGVYDRRKAA